MKLMKRNFKNSENKIINLLKKYKKNLINLLFQTMAMV